MTSELASALLRRARSWAGQITKASKALAPNHLKTHIHSEAKEIKEGFISITTYVDHTADGLPNYGTKDAHAQEFGSGIHARRGAKKKYTIAPKTKKVLAFHWDVADMDAGAEIAGGGFSKFTFLPDGRVIFPYVEHPGIQAANSGKGYIGPVWNVVRQKAKKELLADGSRAIKLTLSRSLRGNK